MRRAAIVSPVRTPVGQRYLSPYCLTRSRSFRSARHRDIRQMTGFVADAARAQRPL